ncbi:class II glutamine amidotransferase [Gammaproteobacteria bacterium 45_16_T64]|nr:class II glutamine amidotransferase [Gammaproteobacteria bacterium 45_16_T64]
MCELLGMSANVPTDICFSFSGLMQRGGRTGPHKDGWGIAFFEGKGVREFKDVDASANSEIAKFVRNYPIKSHIVVSHIRQANSGKIALENTHPFSREMWGRPWVYAHNGQLKGIKKKPLIQYCPVGTTDSEHALCYLLDQLKLDYDNRPNAKKTFFKRMHEILTQISVHGVFNVLLSDSEYLYCFCTTKLCWITRKAPFGSAQLKDDDVTINFHDETTPNDIVSVVATAPLTTNEEWNIMEPGELVVFKAGEVVAHY